MQNELKVFENEEFGNVRVVVHEGKELFCASDVAKALGYKDAINAVKQHCRSVVKHHIPHPQSKTKTIEANFINEGDLYRLVAHSQLPSAIKFESWVFDEVLPDIRKHGVYMTDNVLEQTLSNPDFMIELLTKYKAEKQARLEAENKNAILMHTNKLYTSTEIAKELDMKSANALNKELNDKHIQYFVNGTWVLYSDYANLGYVSIKQNVLDNGKVVYDRKWTQTGRDFILSLYK